MQKLVRLTLIKKATSFYKLMAFDFYYLYQAYCYKAQDANSLYLRLHPAPGAGLFN